MFETKSPAMTNISDVAKYIENIIEDGGSAQAAEYSVDRIIKKAFTFDPGTQSYVGTTDSEEEFWKIVEESALVVFQIHMSQTENRCYILGDDDVSVESFVWEDDGDYLTAARNAGWVIDDVGMVATRL